MSRSTWILASAALLAGLLSEERSPVHRPAAGERLGLRFESTIELELFEHEMSLVHEGVELDWWVFPIYAELRAERRIELDDEWLAVEEGELRRVRRFYHELVEDRTFTLLRHVREEPERRSVLEREHVLFERGHRTAWRARSEREESRLPETALAALVPDADPVALLPGRAVEPGDEWTAPGAALRAVLEPGGHVDFAEPSERLGPHDPLDPRLFDELEGELEITFASIEEVEGRRLAVLAFEGRVTGSLEQHLTGEVARLGDDVRQEGEERIDALIVLEPKGELRWDLGDQRLHSLDVRVEVDIEEEIESASPDRRTTGDYEGSWSGTWEVAARRAD